MTGQPKQPTRNRKIEPLNWAEAANSPALKGMMSFLDIRPEEVRSGKFKNVPAAVAHTDDPVSETPRGGNSLPLEKATKNSPAKPVIEIRPKTPPSTASLPSNPLEVPRAEVLGSTTSSVDNDALPVSDSRIGHDTPSMRESLTGYDTPAVRESRRPIGIILGSVPSQNRKIRKCRLSQDAHSAGEETLYRILWDEGRPESENPLGARIVRIGYAELANKARMHKANVRLNLSNLIAKLAIEQSGDFNSRDMIAKAYRVLSYKEILERRRAAGLEYVIRQKNVVFVTEYGEPIPLSGLAQKGRRQKPKHSGDDRENYPVSESRTMRDSLTGVKPMLGRVEESTRGVSVRGTPTMSVTNTVSESRPVSVSTIGDASSSNVDMDFACVSKALNTYSSVDDAATDQLIRACRKIRPDAQAQEIAFFVLEKLELARSSRAINNPVGLILATVPQSFVGYSFDIFRRRQEENKRLAEEESIRKAEDDRRLKEWIIGEARKTLNNPDSSMERKREAEKVVATYSVSQTEID